MPNWFRLKTDSKIRFHYLFKDIMPKEEIGEEQSLI